MTKFTLIFLLLLGNSLAFAESAANPKSVSKMNKFIDQLMAKMSIEEKVGQLVQYTAEMDVTGNSMKENYREELERGHAGSVFNAYGPEFTRSLQKLAVEKSRLHIPLIFGYDVIHGHKTIFPIPLGEAATWNLALMEKTARAAASEAAADGLHWTFAPMVDVSRDPRWGRISEGAGEDSWLGSKIAEARVRGFQGKGLGELDSVMACVKHFAVYGAVTAGREYNTVSIGPQELFEVYLPPYEAAVRAGVASVMPSFNEINGVPSTSNEWLLNTLLREKWKFKGFTVSDYTAIEELIQHGVAAEGKEAARLALKAGVDMDMQDGYYMKYVPALVREGKISSKILNASVRRILEAKYKLGLFDNPYRYSDTKRAEEVIKSPENKQLARESARESIVLLKNENHTLPLKKSGKIALIGPLVQDRRNLIGNWSAAGDNKASVSLYDGIKQAVGDKAEILYSKGANFLEDRKLVEFLNVHHGDIEIDKKSPEDLIKEAVRIAKRSDVIVAALGETQGMSGEAASRTSIRVPENQLALLKALKETKKPLVLLLTNGRPLALETENELADAMVETWFLGSESGNAIADVLFGDYNPSGRLTISFPRNEGQIPITYSEKNTGRPKSADPKNKYSSKYLDAPNTPLFPFGFGLSYTHFTYSKPVLSHQKLKSNQRLKVSVDVTNDGDLAGEEVVQLYVRDVVSSVTRPMKQLRGFKKVKLAKGETKKVELELSIEDLKFYDKNMKLISEPGEFRVMVGGDSAHLEETTFTLL